MALRRLAARAVDLFTIFFLTFALAVTVLFAVMRPLSDALDIGPWGTSFAPTLLFGIVAVLYETAFVCLRGQTPGKDLLNLRVTRTDDTIPTRETALGRSIVLTLPLLAPDPAIGVIVVLAIAAPVAFGSAGLHERIARTMVSAYDADAEEPALPGVPPDAIEERYGPRSWWRALTKETRS